MLYVESEDRKMTRIGNPLEIRDRSGQLVGTVQHMDDLSYRYVVVTYGGKVREFGTETQALDWLNERVDFVTLVVED